MPPKAIPDSEARSKERWAIAKANGYQIGANKDEDRLKDQNKYTEKVKKDHATTLHLYVE